MAPFSLKPWPIVQMLPLSIFMAFYHCHSHVLLPQNMFLLINTVRMETTSYVSNTGAAQGSSSTNVVPGPPWSEPVLVCFLLFHFLHIGALGLSPNHRFFWGQDHWVILTTLKTTWCDPLKLTLDRLASYSSHLHTSCNFSCPKDVLVHSRSGFGCTPPHLVSSLDQWSKTSKTLSPQSRLASSDAEPWGHKKNCELPHWKPAPWPSHHKQPQCVPCGCQLPF